MNPFKLQNHKPIDPPKIEKEKLLWKFLRIVFTSQILLVKMSIQLCVEGEKPIEGDKEHKGVKTSWFLA